MSRYHVVVLFTLATMLLVPGSAHADGQTPLVCADLDTGRIMVGTSCGACVSSCLQAFKDALVDDVQRTLASLLGP